MPGLLAKPKAEYPAELMLLQLESLKVKEVKPGTRRALGKFVV
jgi:hypothetical protein